MNTEKIAEQTGISVKDIDFIKSRSPDAFKGDLSRKLMDVLKFDSNDPRRKLAMEILESALNEARKTIDLDSDGPIIPAP